MTSAAVLPSIHLHNLGRSHTMYESSNRHTVLQYVTGVHISTPSSYNRSSRSSLGASSRINRPRTAAAVLTNNECDRVSQVEHEPTRRHNLENHMPLKRARPPPWQKNLDPPMVPFVCGPGYILSRSKSKFAMTIKDEFFEPPEEENASSGPRKKLDNERDSLISQLQQQISDLTLYLEEERLNHKQTKQRAEEFLRDQIDELHKRQREQTRDLEEDHEDEMDKLRNQLEADKTQMQTAKDKDIEKMRKEIEFLQGSFASYKTTVHLDQDEKWKKREHDMTMLMEENKQTAMHELRTKFIQEKNSERINVQKDHQKNIDNLRKDHKKELDALVRRFSNVAADLERLKRTTAELKEVKSELEEVKNSYNETCKLLATTTRDLADTKVKLMSFEEQFEEKVQQVDDKYKDQINSLMTKNVELRRLYVKKCGELYDEKVSADEERVVRVSSAKEVMHSMLKSKHKADVSFTPGEILTPEEKSIKTLKYRRSSAPITQEEAELAYQGSGKLDYHVDDEDDFILADPIIPESRQEIEEMRKELLGEIEQTVLDGNDEDELF
ncbi:flagellum-associated coiled-coil domain-containing protein 1-like isoform X2 [Mytilus edulis]|uniref:flagellum-associated coiled-coil domain-containing protein 1-like isoform X2 n=1 Tax=Mytilus edulis TaxID=6550 RepID=UPI0039F12A6A